jgi:hypothetical protein
MITKILKNYSLIEGIINIKNPWIYAGSYNAFIRWFNRLENGIKEKDGDSIFYLNYYYKLPNNKNKMLKKIIIKAQTIHSSEINDFYTYHKIAKKSFTWLYSPVSMPNIEKDLSLIVESDIKNNRFKIGDTN